MDPLTASPAPSRRRSVLLALLSVLVAATASLPLRALDEPVLLQGEAGPSPAVLLVTPQNYLRRLVDFQYLEELHEAGFEPDHLDDLEEFTWERIRQYHVLVIFGAPSDGPGPPSLFGSREPGSQRYAALVERFLQAGGGVFAMLYTHNADAGLREMLDPWGARLPLERFVERDTSRIAPLPRMGSRGQLVLLDDIQDSPISHGVEQLWWPYGAHFNTSMTAPLAVSKDWRVVVRGSPSSRTEVVTEANTQRYEPPPPDPLVRKGGVAQPPLLAIRDYSQGRILLTAQYPQFSLGQGTRWLYDERSLRKGLEGRPSHWDRMIRQALRWLAEPSLGGDELGGYRLGERRLVPPAERPGARARLERRFFRDPAKLPATPRGTLYRGLIGARSLRSGGGSSVEAYAAAARRAGLDFLVFMEDFAELTEKELRELDAACRRHSGDDLLLIPGYTLDSNVGNHLFFYGYGLPWPPDFAIHRDASGAPRLNLQMQDEQGRYIRSKTTHNWLLRAHETGGFGTHNIGYYDFDDPRALAIHDTKDATAAALRTYRKGVLVDEQLEDYLLTAESTMPKLPVVVRELTSAEQLEREVGADPWLMHVHAASLAKLPEALGWYGQYGGENAFVSNGPRIEAWAGFPRLFTWAAAPFVISQEWMPALLHVRSEAPLREVSVYDGSRRIRRFLPEGKTELRTVLHLSTVRQQSLIVVAEDEKGRQAISSARRHRREGGLGVSFCGDHVNHCTPRGLLGRGVGMFQLQLYPLMGLDRAGITWDGGPEGLLPLVRFAPATLIESNEGREGDRPYNNLPMLEMADDHAVVVRSLLDEVYDEAVPALNAWHTWGPLEPSRLLRSLRRFGRFHRPSIGPEGNRAYYAEREGAIVAWYENQVTFKRAQRVQRLRLARSGLSEAEGLSVALAPRASEAFQVHALAEGKRKRAFAIPQGGWFGFFADRVGNASLFVNRGEPVVLQTTRRSDGRILFEIEAALAGEKVAEGSRRHYELFSINEPLDPPGKGVPRFLRLRGYLRAPDGLRLERGTRLSDPGFVSVRAEGGAVELGLARPPQPIGIPLPLRVHGLDPDWSIGIFQIEGYTPGAYTDGRGVYQSLGVDRRGRVHVSLYPDHAPRTHVVVGHPVVSDAEGLVIEAMPRPGAPASGARYAWHVAVNNPTDAPIRATFRRAMALPGLDLEPVTRTIPAGGQVVLEP